MLNLKLILAPFSRFLKHTAIPCGLPWIKLIVIS